MSASDKQLSSGDVCEIVGLELHVLNDWCVKKLVKPVAGGTKQGDHRRWTPMQALGLAVAIKVYKSARGCHLTYIGLVVEGFSKLTEEDLQKHFENGKTHFMHAGETVKGGPYLVLDGPRYDDMIDLRQTRADVMKAIARVERRLKRTGGRTRGLAEKRRV